MNTANRPLAVGEIVGDRASMLQVGMIVEHPALIRETVFGIDNDTNHIMLHSIVYDNVKGHIDYYESRSFTSYLWDEYRIVSLAPRKPAIDYDDPSPLTREVVEEYGFDSIFNSGVGIDYVEYESDVAIDDVGELIPIQVTSRCEISFPTHGIMLHKIKTAGQFRALMKALSIEPKGKDQ